MSDPIVYPGQLVDLVGAELTKVGETIVGSAEAGRHGAPRRYHWVPEDSPLSGPSKTMVGDGVRYLDAVALRFAVVCWGHSFDDCWWMVCALETALKRVLKGRQYRATSLTPAPSAYVHEGFALVVHVELQLHVPSVDVTSPPPTPTPDASKAGALVPDPNPPTPTYGDTETTTVAISDVVEVTEP